MQDVVPPPQMGAGRFGSKPYTNKSRRRPIQNPSPQPAPSSRGLGASSPGARVVELDWRLPARLRRPVKQELERQRRRRRTHQAVVQFARRPLYDDVVSKPQSDQRTAQPPRRQVADGYQVKNPAARMNLPPYVGAFTRQLGAAAPRVRRRARTVAPAKMQPRPARRRITSEQKPRRNIAALPVPAKRVIASAAFPLVERDVPFGFEPIRRLKPAIKAAPPASQQVAVVQQPTSNESVVVKPRRRFALPLHFSIWPKDTSGETSPTRTVRSGQEYQPERQIAASKKKRHNHALM